MMTSPPLTYGFHHVNAASTSVPPPMRIRPGPAGVTAASAALPVIQVVSSGGLGGAASPPPAPVVDDVDDVVDVADVATEVDDVDDVEDESTDDDGAPPSTSIRPRLRRWSSRGARRGRET